jgi:hypothetical protein
MDYMLDLDVSLADLSWPPFIGGQVSRIRSGSIQISLYKIDYNTISYFDYDYASIFILGLDFMDYYLNRPQGYQRRRLWYLSVAPEILSES